ncbi:MAG: hypothetical protein KAS18_06375 [Calditrichia bacterium]|nr:hypothetical protein [Calditrichia bacterium]
MQLVNIATPQNFISNDLITSIQSRDLPKSKEIISCIKDYKIILRSYYKLSCKQSEIKNYLNSAIVFTDAISEIIIRLFPEDPHFILDASLEYFGSLNYSTAESNLPKSNPEDANSPVVVKELSESIEKGELENSFRISKKLLMVMDSKSYFNDLLLEMAAKSYTDTGESIIIINSICKAFELFEWKMIDELIWYALNLLISENFKSRQKILTPSDKEIKYSEYVLKAASDPGEHGANLLLMGHARQIYRAASVKYKEIWAYLSSFIQTKLEKTPIEEIQEIEPAKGSITDFEKSISMKDVQLTMTFVNEILKSEVNVDELFGSIALSLLENEKFKSPEIVIYLNMARRLATALDYPRNLLVYKSFLEYLYSENLVD